MALIECPECQRQISDKAAACPHCGHPIATVSEYELSDLKRRAKKRSHREENLRAEKRFSMVEKGIWSGFITLALAGFVWFSLVGSHTKDKAENDHPSCNTDWHQCSDNSDFANHYFLITHAQSDCIMAAENVAKFGSPKWPWLAFSSFYPGDDIPKTGIAVLVEQDVQFSNAFGAMVHSRATCRYDLNQKKVLNIVVAPN